MTRALTAVRGLVPQVELSDDAFDARHRALRVALWLPVGAGAPVQELP